MSNASEEYSEHEFSELLEDEEVREILHRSSDWKKWRKSHHGPAAKAYTFRLELEDLMTEVEPAAIIDVLEEAAHRAQGKQMKGAENE